MPAPGEEGASNYVIVTLPGDLVREKKNDELVILACERDLHWFLVSGGG